MMYRYLLGRIWLVYLIVSGNRARVREDLSSLLDKVNAGTQDKHYGICYQVTVPVEVLMFGFRSWDEYSGVHGYPVSDPTNKGVGAKRSYFNSVNKWDGEYGAARVRLLNHLYSIVR